VHKLNIKENTLRIATRRSPLALWQADFVKECLEKKHPTLEVQLLPMSTKGDEIIDRSLSDIGGKGLFVKELEKAILNNEADIAVHSMKDVPMKFPDGLGLAVICRRGDSSDALVSNHYRALTDLPVGAKVGTSSLRRKCQLLQIRKDLQIIDLRGNVGTRLKKLDAGDYDAIVLASAGLSRLGLESRILQRFSSEEILPAGGQGAVGVECRFPDKKTLAFLQCLHDPETAYEVTAERSLNRVLNGGCQAPIASFAEFNSATDELHLRGMVGDVSGIEILLAEGRMASDNAEDLGRTVAQKLLDQGAQRLLDQANYNN
jgi:hydroxymethylbilane synthase